MNTEIESMLIEVLKEEYPEFDIIPFPIDFAEYDFTNHDGCILLKYENSTYGSQNTVWDVRQDETYQYKILCGLRYLTSFNQANPYISKLKELLQGLFVVNHKCTLKQVKIEGVENGDLWFSITVNLALSTRSALQSYGGVADEAPI